MTIQSIILNKLWKQTLSLYLKYVEKGKNDIILQNVWEMGFFEKLRFLCFCYILVLITIGLFTAIYVNDDEASWLIPLLIGLSVVLLILAIAFLVRKKIKENLEEIEEIIPEEALYAEANERSNDRDKLTLNPVFLEQQEQQVVYLPTQDVQSMQVLGIERFQGELLPWPGSGGGKEEMTVELSFDDEDEEFHMGEISMEDLTLKDATLSFANDNYQHNEPIYDHVEDNNTLSIVERGIKQWKNIEKKASLERIEMQTLSKRSSFASITSQNGRISRQGSYNGTMTSQNGRISRQGSYNGTMTSQNGGISRQGSYNGTITSQNGGISRQGSYNGTMTSQNGGISRQGSYNGTMMSQNGEISSQGSYNGTMTAQNGGISRQGSYNGTMTSRSGILSRQGSYNGTMTSRNDGKNSQESQENLDREKKFTEEKIYVDIGGDLRSQDEKLYDKIDVQIKDQNKKFIEENNDHSKRDSKNLYEIKNKDVFNFDAEPIVMDGEIRTSHEKDNVDKYVDDLFNFK